MKEQRIIVKGPAERAILETIRQTITVLTSSLIEEPRLTINASMYVKDVNYLLSLVKEEK